MRRGIAFCGAFNPPTIAHIELANQVRREQNFDCVIFVPSRQEYIRQEQGKDFAFTNQDRLEMLNKIAESRDWMYVSDHELNLSYQPRTFETLTALKEKGYQLSLLLGSDKLPELEHHWRHVREMAEEFGFIVISRNGDNAEKMVDSNEYLRQLKPYITFASVDTKYQYVSSTMVRQHLKEISFHREEIEKLLPPELNGLKDYFGR